MNIHIINGPNLNLLGFREPNIYGTKTLKEINKELELKFNKTDLFFFQSNIEGEIVEKIHSIKPEEYALCNFGGYTHTSVAIRDAIISSHLKFIEIHISNTYKREGFRKISMMADLAIGVIEGFGLKSYDMAIEYLLSYQQDKKRPLNLK